MQFAMLGSAGSQMPDLVSRDSDSATNLAATTMTFSSMSLGPVDSRRQIAVVVVASDLIANSNTMTDISLAGNSAAAENYRVNDAAYGNAVDVMVGIASFSDTTNTTGNVVVTFNATLSTSGSTYVHVFSLSDVPSGWSTTLNSGDVTPSGNGTLQPISTGSLSSTVKIAMSVGAWEGAGGTSAWTNADVAHANLDVGDATNGFRVYIGEDTRPINYNTINLTNNGWVSGDAACAKVLTMFRS